MEITYHPGSRSSAVGSDGVHYSILWPWLGSDFVATVWHAAPGYNWLYVPDSKHTLLIQAAFKHD